MNTREVQQANRLVTMQKRFKQFYDNRIAVGVHHDSVVVSPEFLEKMEPMEDWDVVAIEDSGMTVSQKQGRLVASKSRITFVAKATIRYKGTRFDAFLTESYCIDHGINWQP